MDAETKQTVGDVFCEVLQNLAFMFAEVVDRDELPSPSGDFRRAQMDFAGPVRGSLQLVVPSPMAREIAANMLGIDLGQEDAPADDAFRELLNVTCGHFLTALAGEDPVFDLSIPQVNAISAREVNALAKDAKTVAVIVDDNPVLLQVAFAE